MRNQGFFSASELTTVAPQTNLPRCGACGLLKQCRSPKLPVVGGGARKVLLVGAFPDAKADLRGSAALGTWWGKVGAELSRYGVNMEKDCWITNALVCHPRGRPSKLMADYCRPNLLNTVAELRPNVVIPFGYLATRAMVGRVWKEDIGTMRQWAGWRIPCQDPNVWVCPTWGEEDLADEKTGWLYERQVKLHLAEALEKMAPFGDRPWKKVPDWRTECRTDLDPERVVALLDEVATLGGLCAIDYEADRLKPDPPDFTVVSASLCWNGTTTVAFPFQGKAVKDAWFRLVRSPRVGFIAANLKYEERVTLRLYGRGVRNWRWDTNIGMHVIDNRPNIVGLKFQAFALLGQPPYEHKTKPYLRSVNKDRGGNSPNRIREIRPSDLLLYNAMDSLLEYKIAEIQSQILGVRL
jgi:uracil-DNA glycosylase family 4